MFKDPETGERPAFRLDAMIEAGEDPASVISYLSKYRDEDALRIFDESVMSERVLQLDFMLGCGDVVPAMLGMYRMLMESAVPTRNRAPWGLWQAMLARGAKADRLKYEIRARFSRIWEYSDVRHPYARMGLVFVKDMDQRMSRLCEKSWRLNLGDAFGPADMEMYITSSDHSVFASRLVAPDAVAQVSDTAAWAAIRKMADGSRVRWRAAAAFICSEKTDPTRKKAMAEKIAQRYRRIHSTDKRFLEIEDRLLEHGSFQEFMFESECAGYDYNRPDVAAYVAATRPDWAEAWLSLGSPEGSIKTLLEAAP